METGALARSSPPRLSRGTVLAALCGESTYGYVRLARVLKAISHSLVQSPPEGSSAADLRALLLECADPAVALASASVTVPQSLVDDFLAGVERIRANALLAPEAFFSIDNDLLIKDLAVCLGQMFPAGARLIDLQSGLPRKLLLWQGAGMPSALRFFHMAGGFRPWFETHVDPRDLSHFNESGLRLMYLRVAALLDANPQVRGVFGGSWFYDPVLEPISPHLAYLQQFPRQHGARLLRAMTTAGMIKGALAKSRRRREAYERGHYRPQWYFLAWPRSALLQWARSQPPVITQPA
jgi:hypothetical protein